MPSAPQVNDQILSPLCGRYRGHQVRRRGLAGSSTGSAVTP
ncbi:hypothetical protein [Nonomuraea rubra]